MTRDNQKARTRRDLVGATLRLLTDGHTPTVADVADAAGVSRRTAYRYFPSAEQLIVDAALEGMRADVEREISGATAAQDISSRVDRLVDALHHLTVDKEHLLRQMIRLTIDRGPIEPGVPARPSRRLDYVEQALSPLRDELPPADYERLLYATAVVIGIEARIVLHDICGLDDDEILRTERWAAHALLGAALREQPSPRRATSASSARAVRPPAKRSAARTQRT